MIQSKYAEPTDLIKFSLTPETAGLFTGQSGLDAMNAALTAASSEADAWLRSQQALPLTDWDDKLRQVVCDIAAFRLFSNYGFNPDAMQNENIIRRYNEAMKWLGLVADQKIITQYPDSDPAFLKAGPFVRTSISPVGFARLRTGFRFRRWF